MWNSRALVFDLDDTLLSESSYFAAIFSRFCLYHQWPDEAFLDLIDNFKYVRNQKKNIFEYFLLQNYRFIQNPSKKVVRELHEELFALYISLEVNLEPMSGVKKWIYFAKKHDFKMGVITNGVVAAQRNKWKCLRRVNKSGIEFLPARLELIEKPNPDVFLKMSRALSVPIDQITFFGDRL